jgi:phenylacetic acid degradation protein
VTFYEIDGVVPAADPSAYVHPLASVIGDVIIGPGCYVGPGASLRGIRAGTTVPPRSLVVGNPAKILRELDTETVQWKRNGVHVYQELARRSRSGLRAVDPLPAPEPDRPRVKHGFVGLSAPA